MITYSKLQSGITARRRKAAVINGLCRLVCSIGYFRFYVILGFIFILLATAIGTFMPVWEARNLFAKVSGQSSTLRFCPEIAWNTAAAAC